MVKYIRIIQYAGVICLLIVAFIQDIKSRKIKNYLFVSGLILGLAVTVLEPEYSAADWAKGTAVGFATGFIFWCMGMFCAGDAKLLCVIGSCWGVSAFINCFLLTVLIGGIFSVFYMIVKRELKVRMKNLFSYIKSTIFSLRFVKYTPPSDLKNDLPFSSFILLGTIVSLLTGNSLFV